jgi:hypothetical protein
MIQTTQTETGQHIATVGTYRTPAYYTAEMAVADAQCWEAFHGEENNMITITADETFVIPTQQGDRIVDGAHVIRSIETARRLGVEVTEIVSGTGVRYIQTHRGGSQYCMYIRQEAA